jgi:hypothetical protein
MCEDKHSRSADVLADVRRTAKGAYTASDAVSSPPTIPCGLTALRRSQGSQTGHQNNGQLLHKERIACARASMRRKHPSPMAHLGNCLHRSDK